MYRDVEIKNFTSKFLLLGTVIGQNFYVTLFCDDQG